MRKKWLLSATLAVGLFAIPSVGFSAQAKISPNQITLESGGFGGLLSEANEYFPGLYHLPIDGITAGNGGIGFGCVPDVHEFNKSIEGGESIIFTAGVSELATNSDAVAFLNDFTIYVEITSNGEKVLELPFYYHGNPETGDGVDPNTGKPFWVSALYFNEAYPGATVVDLPTGEYNYKFIAKANGKNGHVLDVWVPKNHKFTIIDNGTNN
jgi:hypothetical protein